MRSEMENHDSVGCDLYEQSDSKYRLRKVRENLDLFVMERNERHLTSLQWNWQKLSKRERRADEFNTVTREVPAVVTEVIDVNDTGSRTRSRAETRQKLQEELRDVFYDRWKKADDLQRRNTSHHSSRYPATAESSRRPSLKSQRDSSLYFSNSRCDSHRKNWSRHGHAYYDGHSTPYPDNKWGESAAAYHHSAYQRQPRNSLHNIVYAPDKSFRDRGRSVGEQPWEAKRSDYMNGRMRDNWEFSKHPSTQDIYSNFEYRNPNTIPAANHRSKYGIDRRTISQEDKRMPQFPPDDLWSIDPVRMTGEPKYRNRMPGRAEELEDVEGNIVISSQSKRTVLAQFIGVEGQTSNTGDRYSMTGEEIIESPHVSVDDCATAHANSSSHVPASMANPHRMSQNLVNKNCPLDANKIQGHERKTRTLTSSPSTRRESSKSSIKVEETDRYVQINEKNDDSTCSILSRKKTSSVIVTNEIECSAINEPQDSISMPSPPNDNEHVISPPKQSKVHQESRQNPEDDKDMQLTNEVVSSGIVAADVKKEKREITSSLQNDNPETSSLHPNTSLTGCENTSVENCGLSPPCKTGSFIYDDIKINQEIESGTKCQNTRNEAVYDDSENRNEDVKQLSLNLTDEATTQDNTADKVDVKNYFENPVVSKEPTQNTSNPYSKIVDDNKTVCRHTTEKQEKQIQKEDVITTAISDIFGDRSHGKSQNSSEGSSRAFAQKNSADSSESNAMHVPSSRDREIIFIKSLNEGNKLDTESLKGNELCETLRPKLLNIEAERKKNTSRENSGVRVSIEDDRVSATSKTLLESQKDEGNINSTMGNANKTIQEEESINRNINHEIRTQNESNIKSTGCRSQLDRSGIVTTQPSINLAPHQEDSQAGGCTEVKAAKNETSSGISPEFQEATNNNTKVEGENSQDVCEIKRNHCQTIMLKRKHKDEELANVGVKNGEIITDISELGEKLGVKSVSPCKSSSFISAIGDKINAIHSTIANLNDKLQDDDPAIGRNEIESHNAEMKVSDFDSPFYNEDAFQPTFFVVGDPQGEIAATIAPGHCMPAEPIQDADESLLRTNGQIKVSYKSPGRPRFISGSNSFQDNPEEQVLDKAIERLEKQLDRIESKVTASGHYAENNSNASVIEDKVFWSEDNFDKESETVERSGKVSRSPREQRTPVSPKRYNATGKARNMQSDSYQKSQPSTASSSGEQVFTNISSPRKQRRSKKNEMGIKSADAWNNDSCFSSPAIQNSPSYISHSEDKSVNDQNPAPSKIAASQTKLIDRERPRTGENSDTKMEETVHCRSEDQLQNDQNLMPSNADDLPLPESTDHERPQTRENRESLPCSTKLEKGSYSTNEDKNNYKNSAVNGSKAEIISLPDVETETEQEKENSSTQQEGQEDRNSHPNETVTSIPTSSKCTEIQNEAHLSETYCNGSRRASEPMNGDQIRSNFSISENSSDNHNHESLTLKIDDVLDAYIDVSNDIGSETKSDHWSFSGIRDTGRMHTGLSDDSYSETHEDSIPERKSAYSRISKFIFNRRKIGTTLESLSKSREAPKLTSTPGAASIELSERDSSPEIIGISEKPQAKSVKLNVPGVGVRNPGQNSKLRDTESDTTENENSNTVASNPSVFRRFFLSIQKRSKPLLVAATSSPPPVSLVTDDQDKENVRGAEDQIFKKSEKNSTLPGSPITESRKRSSIQELSFHTARRTSSIQSNEIYSESEHDSGCRSADAEEPVSSRWFRLKEKFSWKKKSESSSSKKKRDRSASTERDDCKTPSDDKNALSSEVTLTKPKKGRQIDSNSSILDRVSTDQEDVAMSDISKDFNAAQSRRGSTDKDIFSSHGAGEVWTEARAQSKRSLLEGLGTRYCVVPDFIWKHIGQETDDEPLTRKKCIAFILGTILIILLLAILLGLIIGLATGPANDDSSPIRFIVIPSEPEADEALDNLPEAPVE